MMCAACTMLSSPGDLEELGLTLALSSMVDEVARVHDTISWSMHLDNIDDLYPPQAQTVIYRIIQEILNNIGKHANASRVAVIIKRKIKGPHLRLRTMVKDSIWRKF